MTTSPSLAKADKLNARLDLLSTAITATQSECRAAYIAWRRLSGNLSRLIAERNMLLKRVATTKTEAGK